MLTLQRLSWCRLYLPSAILAEGAARMSKRDQGRGLFFWAAHLTPASAAWQVIILPPLRTCLMPAASGAHSATHLHASRTHGPQGGPEPRQHEPFLPVWIWTWDLGLATAASVHPWPWP